MNGIGKYQETAVVTADGGKLIIMLYDGAIRFLNLAIKAIQQNDYKAKSDNLKKAMDIILELNTVLNMEAGGEIASNLRSLYNFMMTHLTRAGAKNDITMIKDVIKCLDELNQGWKAIV